MTEQAQPVPSAQAAADPIDPSAAPPTEAPRSPIEEAVAPGYSFDGPALEFGAVDLDVRRAHRHGSIPEQHPGKPARQGVAAGRLPDPTDLRRE